MKFERLQLFTATLLIYTSERFFFFCKLQIPPPCMAQSKRKQLLLVILLWGAIHKDPVRSCSHMKPGLCDQPLLLLSLLLDVRLHFPFSLRSRKELTWSALLTVFCFLMSNCLPFSIVQWP